MRSSICWEELGVESLLHMERSQLRRLRHLLRPIKRRPRGKARTHWRDNVSRLVWECLGVLLDEFEEVTGTREV